MSDFGSELGNSGLNIMGKLIDALMKLIAKIYDTWRERTSAEYKLKKAELGEIQFKSEKRKFTEKINGKTGFVAHQDLIRAGVPITDVGITIDDKGFQELAARCKREGIVISGVEDMRARALAGNKNMIVECKKSDLKKLATLIDLMNDEKKIAKLQTELGKIENENVVLQQEFDKLKLIEEPNEEHIARIEEIEIAIGENNGVAEALMNEIDKIRTSHKEQLNQEQMKSLIEEAITGEVYENIGFDEAVDRWTGGEINRDITCYVVDAKDPEKYIVCNATNDVFRGKTYIKTDYEVFRGDKMVYKTNDGRFEGREKWYWKSEKDKMRSSNGMGKTVIKFYSLSEMEQFKASFERQKKEELDILNKGGNDRDYDAIISSLTAKIEKNGISLQNGVVVDKETGEKLTVTEDVDSKKRIAIAEANVVARQIDNYKEMKGAEEQLAIARAEMLTANLEEKDKAIANYNQLEEKYNSFIKKEECLIDERKGVNAVQASEEVNESRTNNSLNSRSEEKQDNRRGERVSDIDNKRQTMAEYKGAIEDKRAEGAKKLDVADKTKLKENTKASIPKKSER